MGGLIEYVFKGSPAERLGIKSGDTLLSINGHCLEDLIDYNYYSAEEQLLLEVRHSSGEIAQYRYHHDPDRDFGLRFSANVFDGIRACRNNCLFCFVSQLPGGCRSTMYLKDDDYRMSFMEGSYITATNMTEADFARIRELRLSPLYISIHTTNPQLRVKLLKNPRAAEIMQVLNRLRRDEISFHGQLVLCPGFNDGEELLRTIEELLPFRPWLLSLALVPVGLTSFQKHEEMRLFNKQEAAAVIGIAAEYQDKLGEDNFIYIADEFYLLAGLPFPPASHYNDFCQIENGVGMSAALYDEWELVREELPEALESPKELNLLTGISGAEVLRPIVDDLCRIKNLKVKLFPIKNCFFGESVTVTGLVTGSCIVSAMKEWRQTQAERPNLIIPDVMLKFDAPVFLDDMSVEQLSLALDADIKVIGNDAAALAELVEEI